MSPHEAFGATDRDFEFEGRLSRLEERVNGMISDLTEIKNDVHEISKVIVGSKGGFRVMAIMFGGAVAIGGLVASWLSLLGHKP